MSGMKVAIVGGGVAGLTAALALHQKDLTPIVLERAEAFSEVGAGLQLGPNAVKVLDALGLGEGLRAAADVPAALAIRSGYSNEPGLTIALGQAAEARWRAPYLHILRADLVRVLEAAARERGIELRLGSAVCAVQEASNTVSITLEGGEHLEADVAVAADGVRSPIRKALWGEDAPTYAGSVAWRAVVDMTVLGRHRPEGAATVWTGRGCHAVTYNVRGGTLANLVAVVDTPNEALQSWQETGSGNEVLAHFRGFQPTVLRLIRKTARLHKWGIYERPLAEQWMRGRVCLLGDACHALPPFLAQGAGMAIEDAYLLARALESAPDYASAYRTYQRMRQARVKRVQETSRANGKRFHLSSALGRMAAVSALGAANVIAKGPLLQQFDWLYGYDAVTVPL